MINRSIFFLSHFFNQLKNLFKFTLHIINIIVVLISLLHIFSFIIHLLSFYNFLIFLGRYLFLLFLLLSKPTKTTIWFYILLWVSVIFFIKTVKFHTFLLFLIQFFNFVILLFSFFGFGFFIILIWTAFFCWWRILIPTITFFFKFFFEFFKKILFFKRL